MRYTLIVISTNIDVRAAIAETTPGRYPSHLGGIGGSNGLCTLSVATDKSIDYNRYASGNNIKPLAPVSREGYIPAMELQEILDDLPLTALHPSVHALLRQLLNRINQMALNLANLQAAVTAAVATIDAGSTSQFTAATQAAAVAAQQASDATAQAAVDATNQSEVDAMTASLTAAGPPTAT